MRLVRARPPGRQQLAWLVCVVFPLLAALPGRRARWVFAALCLHAARAGPGRGRPLPAAGHRGPPRPGLRRRSPSAVVLLYLAWRRPPRGPGGQAVPGAGRGRRRAGRRRARPARERLQPAADRFVYGGRRDPVPRSPCSAPGSPPAAEPDLLPALLGTVTGAQRAAGGRVLAAVEPRRAGPPARCRPALSAASVGATAGGAPPPRRPYTPAAAGCWPRSRPQVAVVVRALDLAEALEAERDRVVAATHTERDRLRRDLHDGLGPSLAGIGLGLQAATRTHWARRRAAHRWWRASRKRWTAPSPRSAGSSTACAPPRWTTLGLAGAMRRHAGAGAVGGSPRACRRSCRPLPPDVESAAYRITQRGPDQRRPSSRAQPAVVSADERTLLITVTDDGDGIPPQGLPSGRSGPGLDAIRARAVGGRLVIASAATAPPSPPPCRWTDEHGQPRPRGHRRRPPHVPLRPARRH